MMDYLCLSPNSTSCVSYICLTGFSLLSQKVLVHYYNKNSRQQHDFSTENSPIRA